jgi:hypothetical protein
MKMMNRLLFFLAVNKTHKWFNPQLIYFDVASIVYGYTISGKIKRNSGYIVMGLIPRHSHPLHPTGTYGLSSTTTCPCIPRVVWKGLSQ